MLKKVNIFSFSDNLILIISVYEGQRCTILSKKDLSEVICPDITLWVSKGILTLS